MSDDQEELVVAYHEQTKHHYRRFAASLGFLDWASQPDPFRRYRGAPLLELPLPAPGNPLPFWKLYTDNAPQPIDLRTLSLFFRYALSLTAWKQLRDSKWALRANPSSGNLHPTEGYALLPALENIPAGIYHYAPKEHALERRADLEPTARSDHFLVALTSIPWREAWKYGERAFRYCQHDVGHALGTLRYAAAALGWKLKLIDTIADDDLAKLLGLENPSGTEPEYPELLAAVGPTLPEKLTLPTARKYYGQANILSQTHIADWPAVDLAARATKLITPSARNENLDDLLTVVVEPDSLQPTPKDGVAEPNSLQPTREGVVTGAVDLARSGKQTAEQTILDRRGGADLAHSGKQTAERVILGRRSAVAMDGHTEISAETFFHMMARLLPQSQHAPWDIIPWRPRIHLGLFVHRVRGLPPGLYALTRDPQKQPALRAAMRPGFLWKTPAACPPHLPLYLLTEGDYRAIAASVSCGQDIAADGAFTVAMIADYLDSLAQYGAPFYRNLFWEAGLVGQVLYLESEEAGIRATGIGCYFDDPTHEVFGLTTRAWQSFYHFTAGGSVEDDRLTTLPAYAHIERATFEP